MKTFQDLVFNINPNSPYLNQQAVLNFDNGYGVSVINGSGAYCTSETFELAVLLNGDLCYTTSLTDSVLGHQTPEQITGVMSELQKLQNAN